MCPSTAKGYNMAAAPPLALRISRDLLVHPEAPALSRVLNVIIRRNDTAIDVTQELDDVVRRQFFSTTKQNRKPTKFMYLKLKCAKFKNRQTQTSSDPNIAGS